MKIIDRMCDISAPLVEGNNYINTFMDTINIEYNKDYKLLLSASDALVSKGIAEVRISKSSDWRNGGTVLIKHVPNTPFLHLDMGYFLVETFKADEVYSNSKNNKLWLSLVIFLREYYHGNSMHYVTNIISESPLSLTDYEKS